MKEIFKINVHAPNSLNRTGQNRERGREGGRRERAREIRGTLLVHYIVFRVGHNLGF